MDATILHDATKEMLAMPAGSKLVYHTGFLAEDRGETGKKTPAQTAVHKTANAFWEMHRNGAVALVQRRLEPGLYEYIAIRNKR